MVNMKQKHKMWAFYVDARALRYSDYQLFLALRLLFKNMKV